MCGIVIVLGEEDHESLSTDLLNQLIDQRGPDYRSTFQNHYTRCKLRLKFKASILHLRGDILTKQPVIDTEGNVLLFNGQIYKYNGHKLEGSMSDTSFLATKLAACVSRHDVVKIIALLDGPFAFVFWHNRINSLFYSRDLFGRKSLCKFSSDNSYPSIISSVCDQNLSVDCRKDCLFWSEVPSGQVHCILFDIDGSFCNEYIYPLSIDDIYQPTPRCNTIKTHYAQVMEPLAITNLLKPLNTEAISECSIDQSQILSTLKNKLTSAIALRINYNWNKCLNCRQTSSSACSHSKLAVAFSGGIDSTLLALIIDKVYPQQEFIDLLTVAFKNNSPDRISVAVAFKELKKLCPNRNWRLIACDIPLVKLQERRLNVIRHLIAPCNTVIDDSVGCACWFIGEGRGRLYDDSKETSLDNFLEYQSSSEETSAVSSIYVSPATMLFVGSGIDEQLGGYSSHKNAWINAKTEGVLEEISFLMRRISTRNMGRDDRVYSHHGRDVKIPYLDYELVSFLNQLPVAQKMNLEEPLNVGPKKLLRSLAHQLGLKETCKQVKRALQFGTRIANLEDSKEKGNQVCRRLVVR